MKLHDRNLAGSQHGIVLFTVLIALVVLSLASVALVRSIDTGVTIAGNLAFRQAATQAADAGTDGTDPNHAARSPCTFGASECSSHR